LSVRQQILSSNSDFIIEVLKGNVLGHRIRHQHGHSEVIGNMAFTDVWADASKMVYLSAVETMNIVSTSTDDASAGTGARTVLVEGLDVNFNPISETVTMNGLTDVLTSLSYIRVTEMTVLTGGALLQNVGTITATGSTTSTTPQAVIEPVLNHSLNGKYTSPAGKWAIFANYEVNVAKGKDVAIDIFAGDGTGIMSGVHRNDIFQNPLVSPVSDVVIPPKTDIVFRAKSDAGSTGVACSFNMLEVEEKYIGLSL